MQTRLGYKEASGRPPPFWVRVIARRHSGQCRERLLHPQCLQEAGTASSRWKCQAPPASPYPAVKDGSVWSRWPPHSLGHGTLLAHGSQIPVGISFTFESHLVPRWSQGQAQPLALGVQQASAFFFPGLLAKW